MSEAAERADRKSEFTINFIKALREEHSLF